MTGRAVVFVSARTLAATTALLLLAAVFVSCGDAQEEVGPDVQPSDTVSPSPSPIVPTATPVVTAEPSTATVPTGWQTYVDPVLGFSFAYPSTLIPTDLPTSNSGLKQRVTDFRPTGAKEPGLAVVVVEDVGDISLRDWVQTYSACNLDARPGTEVAIATRPALVCIGEPLDGQFDHWMIVKDGSRIIYISTTLPEMAFDSVVNSVKFPW